MRRQHLAGLMRGDLEVGDDGDGLDLPGPGELDVVADAVGGFRRCLAGVDAAGRGREDLAERDLDPLDVLGLQGAEIGADEAAVQRGADVVRVSLCSHAHTHTHTRSASGFREDPKRHARFWEYRS